MRNTIEYPVTAAECRAALSKAYLLLVTSQDGMIGSIDPMAVQFIAEYLKTPEFEAWLKNGQESGKLI